MEGLVDLKQKEVGMLYDQVSQQNQFRHREEMQKGQQEFLTGEREAGQQWKLENEIPLKQKEIEQRGELAILQQESLDTQRAIENRLREQSNAIQQQRADTTASGQESETAMDRERLLADQKKLVDSKWEGWDDSYQSRMLKKNDPEGYKTKLAEKEDDYVLASLLPSQQSHYIDAQKGMAGLNATARREIGKTYATMTPEQRDQVWNSLPKGASGRQFGEAVRSIKSGKIPDPTSKMDTSQRVEGQGVQAPQMEDAGQEIFKGYNQPSEEQDTEMASNTKQQDFLQGAMRG
jgi:hypothetical protein